jgi:hypothetical protein
MELPKRRGRPGKSYFEWLALSLTSGLAPTKARKLIEPFGSAEAVLHSSLTELESTGIKAVFGAIGGYREIGRTGAGGEGARPPLELRCSRLKKFVTPRG